MIALLWSNTATTGIPGQPSWSGTTLTSENSRFTDAVDQRLKATPVAKGLRNAGPEQWVRIGRCEKVDRTAGTGDALGQKLKDAAAGLDLDQRRARCRRQPLQLDAEVLERRSVVAGDSSDETGGSFWSVAAGTPCFHPGRSLAHQSLERAIGVCASEPGGSGNGIAGPRAMPQEDLVD